MVRVRGRPFCIGRLWQGVEARFRGLTPIPYLLRRFRVYDGFVFCFGCVWRFRVISLVSHLALGLLCGGLVFAFGYLRVSFGDRVSKLTTFLEFCGEYRKFGAPCLQRLGICPCLLGGERGRSEP